MSKKAVKCKNPQEHSWIGTCLGILISVCFFIGYPLFWKRYYKEFIAFVRQTGLPNDLIYVIWGSL